MPSAPSGAFVFSSRHGLSDESLDVLSPEPRAPEARDPHRADRARVHHPPERSSRDAEELRRLALAEQRRLLPYSRFGRHSLLVGYDAAKRDGVLPNAYTARAKTTRRP